MAEALPGDVYRIALDLSTVKRNEILRLFSYSLTMTIDQVNIYLYSSERHWTSRRLLFIIFHFMLVYLYLSHASRIIYYVNTTFNKF